MAELPFVRLTHNTGDHQLNSMAIKIVWKKFSRAR